jgi:PAS domain S-box-containing protein
MQKELMQRLYKISEEDIMLTETAANEDKLVNGYQKNGTASENGSNNQLALVNNGTSNKMASRWIEPGSDKYKVLVENSLDIITILDKTGCMLYYSPSVEKILGYRDDELLGSSVFEYIHPEDINIVMKTFFDAVLNPEKQVSVEFRFRNADGSYTYLESTGINKTNNESINGVILNSRNVTNKKLAEIENQRLKTAVEQSYESVVITDIDGNIQYVNRKFEEVTGYSGEEVAGKNPRILKSGFTPDDEYKKMWDIISSGQVWEGEFRNKKKNGEYYWESARITPVKNEFGVIINYIAIKDDISELKKREEELIKAVDEKEIMLREIHHRVKNNLQIVSSLLKLQSESVQDPELKARLRVSRNRIKSMALIHQQLFSSPDLRNIEIEDYIYSLSGQVYATFNETPEKIGFKALAKDIFFNVETAIPLGLIISELISNSLNHAFVKRLRGSIEISIEKSLMNDSYKLIYKDDGIGLPYEMVNGSKDSSGIFLVKTLANQLDGSVKIENKLGTVYEIEFCGLKPYAPIKMEKRYDHDPKRHNPQTKNNTFIPFTMMF